MCSAPKPPKPAPPPAEIPTQVSAETTATYDKDKKRRQAAGLRSTILTGNSGVQNGITGAKTVLGG